jgi:type I restriction enzyme S subunit
MKEALSEIAELTVGLAFKSALFVDDSSKTRLLRGKNVGVNRPDWSDTKYWDLELEPVDSALHLAAGDIVIAMDASFTSSGALRASRIGEIDLPALLVQRVARLRPKGGVDGRFLWYVIRSEEFSRQLRSQQTGSVIAHVSGSQILSVECELPTFGEQQAIAGVLGALDDKIESNRRMIATVRQLLASEFQRQLGVTAARTTLRQLIPRMNGVVKTGPFGSNLHASDYGDEGIPLVLVKHVVNGEIASRGLPLVRFDKATELGAYRLAKDDIIITRVGRVGDAALVRGSQVGWLFSGQMLRVSLTGNPLVDPYWLAQWYQTDEFQDLISAYSVGSTRKSLSTSILAVVPIPLVEPLEQASFRAVAEPLHERWTAATRESDSLTSLRDALLPELLSGRLRVRDAEQAVSEAL